MTRPALVGLGGEGGGGASQAEEGSTRDTQEKQRPAGTPSNTSGQAEIAAMKNYDILITHVPTNKSINFPGALQSFDDSFTANFQGTSVYGKMDDIISYQGTKRSINFSFDLIAASDLEAKENLGKISELQSYLYPSFEGGKNSSVTTIQAPPLLRIFFSNLIRSSVSGMRGLMGYLNTVQNAPDFEAGFVTDDAGNIYPKKYTINLSFTVVHEHELGWYKDKKGWQWRGDKNNFPCDQELPVGSSTSATQTRNEQTSQQRAANEGKILNNSKRTSS